MIEPIEEHPVVVRELTAADLGDDVLLDLIRADDRLGALSIYVDGASTATDRRAAIDIRNRLVELERSVAKDGSARLAEALSETLRRIAPAVERLFDPRASGRGRALFASLSAGELTKVSSRLRLPNRVVLDSTPFIHPLLELIDEGRPAGVVLTSSRSADLLEWRLGTCAASGKCEPDPHRRTASGRGRSSRASGSRSRRCASSSLAASASAATAFSRTSPLRRPVSPASVAGSGS